MTDTLIAISTFNRRDLTAVCLSTVMECKEPDTQVMALDDGSTEYDPAWLYLIDASIVVGHMTIYRTGERRDHWGVGMTARFRIEGFAEDEDRYPGYLCLLDNDALVTPGFDVKMRDLYERTRTDGEPHIVSGYRSATHPVAEDHGEYVRMQTIGGICMFMDRFTARHLLNTIPTEAWNHEWDWRVCEAVSRLFAPARSWIEHMGRWGGGVNGVSVDRAFDFVGYREGGG